MKANRTAAWLFAVLVVALGACGDDDPTGPQDPEDVEFAPELGVNLGQMTRLDSGVYIQTLIANDSTIALRGDQIVVNYTAWLSDGTQIDEGAASTFTLTNPPLIEGFVIGFEGTAVGETRLMVIPSELAYGALGRSGIPPHSVLVFRVELLRVNPID